MTGERAGKMVKSIVNKSFDAPSRARRGPPPRSTTPVSSPSTKSAASMDDVRRDLSPTRLQGDPKPEEFSLSM